MKPKQQNKFPYSKFIAITLCFAGSFLTQGARANTFTWDGAPDGGGSSSDALWSTATNWVGDAVPVTGDSLVFDGSTNLNSNNDSATSLITALGATSITFATGAGSFNVSSDAQITVGGNTGGNTNIITKVSTNDQVISAPLKLIGGGRDRTIVMTGGGKLTLSGSIDFANDWLFPSTTAGTIVLSGNNSGDGKGSVLVGGTNLSRAMMRNNVANTQLLLGSDTALGNPGSGSIAGGDANLRGLVANQNLYVGTNGSAVNASGSSFIVNASWIDFNGANNLAISHLLVQSGNRDFKLTSTGSLTVQDGLALSSLNSASASNGQLFLNHSGTGSMTINGPIHDTLHSDGITATTKTDNFGAPANSIFRKSGTGTLILNGDSSSSFTGEMRIESGTVVLGNPNALGPVTYDRAVSFTQVGDTTLDDPFIYLDDATGVEVGQNVSGDGIPAGTTVVSVGGTTIELSQNATATTYPVTLTFSYIQTATKTVVVGNSGSATATLDLNGQTIDNVISKLEGAGMGGNGSLVNSDTVNPASITGDITRVYGTTIGGNGDITLTRLIGQASPTLITKIGAGTLTTSGSNHNNNSSWTINAGTVVLANAAGRGADKGLTIDGGNVKLDGANPDLISDALVVTLNSGTFDLNGKSEAIGALDGTGGTVTNDGGSAATLFVGGGPAGTATGSWSGVIQDGTSVVSLTKEGSGTQTLTGACAYGGGTTVSGGVLSLSSAFLDDTSAVFIDFAGTGAVLNLTHSNTDVVASLDLGSGPLPNGVYNAGNTGGAITGTGSIEVVTVAGSGFTTWADANGASGQTPDQDHDLDGVKNGVEYFMGETGSSFTSTPGLDGTNTVTWPKDPTFDGTYAVQISTDLVNWTDDTGNATDPGTSVTYTLTGAGRKFIRLVVTPN